MRISELEFRRVLFRSTTKSVSVIVRPKLVRAAPISYSSKYCSTIIAGLHQGGVGAEPGGGAFVGENTAIDADRRSEEHTSELQSLMRNSYAVFCLNKKNLTEIHTRHKHENI